MMTDLYSNPFIGINAAQLNDQDILNYWCNPFPHRIFSGVKESDIYNDPNNIVLMGGRSTGKTMILRYWSFPVQFNLACKYKEGNKCRIIDYFKKKGGIGFYIRIDGPILRSFSGSGISDEKWNNIFTHYFELHIAQKYLEVIEKLLIENELDERDLEPDFIREASQLLTSQKLKNFSELIKFVDEGIQEVNEYRGNVPFYRNEFKPKRGFASLTLTSGLNRIIKKSIKNFSEKINFILFIDEYENFSESQQRVINTMMRFSKSDLKFRIGMRLEGFRTHEMISRDDFIKEGREYRKVILEEVINKERGYTKFLEEISRKRLESVKLFRDSGNLDISKILFEIEDIEEEAREIVSNYPNKHFEFFRKFLKSKKVELLKNKNNPLLELLNIIWVIRGETEEVTQIAMNGYLKGETKKEIVKKYRMDYIDKYKLSLMFLLCSIYRKNKKYYSFNTFAYLSSGIIGHFIEICRKAFQYAEFEKKDSLQKAFNITKEQQTKAALDYSESELQQITRMEGYGGLIYKFVNNMGNIFRDFHRDDKLRYPETNQFSVDYNTINEDRYREAFKAAIKWSAIQRKPKLQQAKPGQHLKDIYILNRIFSPSFQISYRTRGGYSIPLKSGDVIRLMSEDIVSSKEFLPSTKSKDKTKEPNLFGEI